MSLADLPQAELFLIRLEVIIGGVHGWAAKDISSAAALTGPNYRGLGFGWGFQVSLTPPWVSLTPPWHLRPPSTSSVFYMLLNFSDMHGHCICVSACKEKKSLSLVLHLILLLIIGEHDSFFSPFPKWATSSTVLLVITNLMGTCKEWGQRGKNEVLSAG